MRLIINDIHGIIGVHSPPKILGPPLDTKAPGPPLIYLVGPLAISDPQGFPQVLQTWGQVAPQNLMGGA